MKKSYLLVFNGLLGNREQVKNLLESMPQISSWRTDLPNAFYIISSDDANTLAYALRDIAAKQGLGVNARFIIAEMNDNKQGWLTPESWYLINNKELQV